ncbi:MFS transporter [Halorubellus sp. JP-L1]|uniref:twin-arginine translocase subunit TatC n=1 Tax=Halorubellus sp. JP-L1 TaxID=2715753 RepID=UPI00140CEB18|nr:twin-arginine translocase subunit TatC [Halorubellus sp. JP-L1]NHN43521.1 MFS transporter [Halorubellus sp. JP-L1]
MPDESDDRDPRDDDGVSDASVEGPEDATSDDAVPDSSSDDAETGDDADVADGEDADAENESADGDGDDVDEDSNDGSGGLEKVDADDGSGGLEKTESGLNPDVEPRSRRVDDPDADGESGADERSTVPDRGVEAGFERPEDAPEKRRPEHPDKLDANGGSDVPVGHAAGAPTPGEATPASAGAGANAGAGTGTGSGRGFDEDGDLFEGPPDDEEMPLADHIEEMMLRLAAVVFAGAVATVLMYLYSDYLVMEMWNDILPAGTDAARPHLYAPLEFILTKIKVASLAGVLIALPVLVYQSYLFMRPGLYPKERRYYIAAVPTSLVLAIFGMAFAYFAVLPGLFQYFDYYTEGNAVIAYGLQSTFNLIVALMGLQAVVFQIPLFVMLAIMMGVTSREWLEGRRLLFWGAFGGIAFLFAPDPTGMAPFIIAVSMIVLFEGTLALLRWTGR